MEILRQEMQMKINEAWSKKMKQMQTFQQQQEQQRKDLNEQTQNFNNAMSQSLTNIADKFVVGLGTLTGKVNNLESKLRQNEERLKEKVQPPERDFSMMTKFQEAI